MLVNINDAERLEETEELLRTVLDCGYADLELLKAVKYDWNAVREHVVWNGEQKDGYLFNSLMRGVVDLGIEHIAEAVNDRICELEAIHLNSRELDKDEGQELKDLNFLRPKRDIQGFFNYLDTSVWFKENGEIYQKYVPEAIESFEHNTGLELA